MLCVQTDEEGREKRDGKGAFCGGLQPGHRKRGADHRGYGDRRELSAGVPQ